MVSKPSRNCLLSIDFAVTTALGFSAAAIIGSRLHRHGPLPLPPSCFAAAAIFVALLRWLRGARSGSTGLQMAQAHLPMDGVLLASYWP